VVPDVPADVEPDVVPDVPADVEPDVVPDVPADVEPDVPGDVGPDVPVPPAPECADSSTCTLHTDCCNCVALAPGESPPPCGLTECFVTACTARGITEADLACSAGRCTVYACETDGVACMSPPPSCADGEVPSVHGLCWGSCVPATECVSIDDCAACDGVGQFCAQYVSRGGPTTYCVERPESCGDTATCACVGDSVCVGIFDSCSDDGGELTCSCPTC
jgi:hypothetical protein